MCEIKKCLKFFFDDKVFMFSLFSISIATYGYGITNFVISKDVLGLTKSSFNLIGQGRFTSFLIDRLFCLLSLSPFFVNFIGMLLLVFSSILLSTIIRLSLPEIELPRIIYIIFSGLFISYSLINEIYVYFGNSIIVGVGYILVFTTILLIQEYLRNNNRLLILLAIGCGILFIGLYESFIPVYLLTIFIYLFCNLINSKFSKKIYDSLKLLILFFCILVASLVIKIIIAKALIYFFNYTSTEGKGIGAADFIYWKYGVIAGIHKLISSTISLYISRIFVYFPIKEFLFAFIIQLIVLGYFIITKEKKLHVLLINIGLTLSIYSLSIVQAIITPFRACQTHALFISFFICLLLSLIYFTFKKIFFQIFCFLSIIIICYQISDTNKWFFLNDLRYSEEKQTITSIWQELSQYDLSKHVVFVGKYKPRNHYILDKGFVIPGSRQFNLLNVARCYAGKEQITEAYTIPTTNITYLLNTANINFSNPNFELGWLFEYNNYFLDCGTLEEYYSGERIAKNMPIYPSKGYVKETADLIVIKIGEINYEVENE